MKERVKKMNKLHLVGTAALAGLMVVGCAKHEDETVDVAKKANEVSIVVDGKTLTSEQIDIDVEKIIEAQGDRIPAAQKDYARQMIRNQMAQSFLFENALVALAKAKGFVVTEADRAAREAEFLKSVAGRPDAPKSLAEAAEKFPLGKDRMIEEFNNGILIQKMIDDAVAKTGTDFAAEAQKVIDGIVSNNNALASTGEDALAKIKAIHAELTKPGVDDLAKKFAAIAAEKSECPSSKKGGDLGEFTHGHMVKEFDEAAFALPVGKVSDPVKTQYGYHLILVSEKIPAVEAKGDTPAAPEKVRASHILIKTPEKQDVPALEDVVRFLKRQSESRLVGDLAKEAVKAAGVTTSDEFKHLLPKEETPAEATPVETTSEK